MRVNVRDKGEISFVITKDSDHIDLGKITLKTDHPAEPWSIGDPHMEMLMLRGVNNAFSVSYDCCSSDEEGRKAGLPVNMWGKLFEGEQEIVYMSITNQYSKSYLDFYVEHQSLYKVVVSPVAPSGDVVCRLEITKIKKS